MSRQKVKELIFVYNANSGKINAGIDFLHKAISPSTYECNLCNITYGIFTERSKWKKYRQEKGVEMKFYYKDQFEQEFKKKIDYPVVVESPGLEIFLSSDQINQLEDLDQLIETIDQKLV